MWGGAGSAWTHGLSRNASNTMEAARKLLPLMLLLLLLLLLSIL
jgi:hypothetical protein